MTLPVRFGRDSSVGIATRYGLEIESRWGRDFPHLSRPALGQSLLYNGYRVFPRGKAAGAWCWPPKPSSVEVKERVELFFYSPTVPSGQVTGWALPFAVNEWYYAPNKEWEIYWWMTNGKDVEWSQSLINVRCCPRISRGWLGEATRITNPWQPIFGSALQAQPSVTNLTAMFRGLEEMNNVQESMWNEAQGIKEDRNRWYLIGQLSKP
jgi:hypothetical protein